MLLYPDNPAFYHPDLPKQVAAQQVLYEFQQTPTNAVSNVHVNQYYQPVAPSMAKPEDVTNTGPATFSTASIPVATPVQHSSLVRHGQNFAQVQFQPLPAHPQHVQLQQYVPGKYFYVNGKVAYQPNLPNAQPRPVTPNYVNFHPSQKIAPNVFHRPLQYRNFQPPQSNQFLPITKPSEKPLETQTSKPVKEEEEEATEEKEDSEDDKTSEESEDDDEYFGRYRFDEEDDEHEYDHEEDDDDSDRDSSRTASKKHHKKTPSSKKNYRFSESYKSSHKYEKPSKKPKKSNYKTTKNSKSREKIQGKQSQNVPVVHKQKIFKEKWYVTKSTDDSL